MSIASEITRISGNIADAYTALDAKGATLPENQNSDNLADTIDTITTGGGGIGYSGITSVYSDFNKAEFDAAISDLDSYVPNNYEDLYARGDAQIQNLQLANHGWEILSNPGQNSKNFVTIAISQNHNYLTILNSYVIGYKVPSSVTVDTTTNSNYVKFYFNGTERTIQIFTSLSNLETSYIKTESSDSGIMGIKGWGLKQKTATTVTYHKALSGTSYFLGSLGSATYPYAYLAYMSIPKNQKLVFSDLFYNNYGTSSQSVRTSANDNFANVIRFLTNWGQDIIEYSADTTIVDSKYIQFNSAVKSAIPLHMGSNCSNLGYSITDAFLNSDTTIIPFILDMSESTSTTDFYFLKGYDSSTHYIPRYKITDVRLILPSTCNVYLANSILGEGVNKAYSLPFNLESYQYIATNAPSVSGKTLHVGRITLDRMISNSSWAAVRTTLESKGWTVEQ